jgi:hypothetical protein
MERFVASCADNESLVRIWPPQLAAVTWSPPIKLVYRDILRLKLAWIERRWPPSKETACLRLQSVPAASD